MKPVVRVVLAALLVTTVWTAGHVAAQAPEPYVFQVISGEYEVYRDGTGPRAQFTQPGALTRHAGTGTFYVIDEGAHTIRKITPAGVVTTLAGSPGVAGNVDGNGSAARFDFPVALAVDTAENAYVADADNDNVRKVTSAGVVTTLAAGLENPRGVALWPDGRVFVSTRHSIVQIATDGTVSTFAGHPTEPGTADGTGTAARFEQPQGLDYASCGAGCDSLLVADGEAIRRIDAAQQVTTLARSGGATTYYPRSVLDDGAGGAYFMAEDKIGLAGIGPTAIWRVTGGGTVSLMHRFSFVGFIRGLARNADGYFYFSNTFSQARVVNRLRSPQDGFHSEHNFAGRGSGCTPSVFNLDGPAPDGRYCGPSGLAVDFLNRLYIADSSNFTLRRMTASGGVTTVAGVRGVPGSGDSFANISRFGQAGVGPTGLAVVPNRGLVIVADTGNHTIRRYDESNRFPMVSTVAGSAGSFGSNDGNGSAARFNSPNGIAVDSAGVIYVADTGNMTIRRISTSGDVTTLAGIPGQLGDQDGTGGGARFRRPYDIEVAADGTLYVADMYNHTIRRVTQAGEVTTLAGSAGNSGQTDGSGSAARFTYPRSLDIHPSGDLIVADYGADRVRRVTPSGVVTTLGTNIPRPHGVAVMADGSIFVTREDSRIMVGTIGAAALTVTSHPSNAVALTGQGSVVTFTVAASGVPTPDIDWQVSINGGATYSNIQDVISGTSGYSGATTATLQHYSVFSGLNGSLHRAVVRNYFGTATSNPAMLTVASATVSPKSLRFAMVQEDGANQTTAAQRITFSYSGPGTPAWTVTPTCIADNGCQGGAAWVNVNGSQTNGAATGAFDISATLASPENRRADLVATLAGVAGSVTVPVTVRVVSRATSQPPVGQVDTPVQNATDVQGAINLSGWVVDDVGLDPLNVPGFNVFVGVHIFRNCVTGESASNCATRTGVAGLSPSQSLSYVTSATFVAGARPDIESAFPNYPRSQVAGWGAQILTNMLPRIDPYAPNGGQGPLTFYVIAIDRDTHPVLLGRAWTETAPTPTSITMANDTIAKPFGTLDTPGPAATVTGTFANFGWALTPDSNTVADATDILIPTNGSTMTVFIDGTAIGNVAYNQCRGDVGNPVPPGVYCNDDIANMFGRLSTIPPRSANPTKYRNLDAARGAIGAFDINTTTLTNGLHTIAWSVTDSAGRTEGIGSRFVNVLNGGGDEAAAPSGRLKPAATDVWTGTETLPDGGRVFRPGGQAVLARTGFDLSAPAVELVADDAGVRHARIAPDGRLELWLGAGVSAGFLDANGERRALPPGSRLDPATGHFTWAPGPGFFGTYRLVFVTGGQKELVAHFPLADEMSYELILPVTVTIRPTRAAALGDSEIRMHVDSPASGALVRATLIDVAGWALDPQADLGSGIDAVHVWAQRRDVPGAAPVFLGAAALNVARPDVARAFGVAAFGHAGFALTSTQPLPPGVYDVTVYAWNRRTARWEDARSVRLTVR